MTANALNFHIPRAIFELCRNILLPKWVIPVGVHFREYIRLVRTYWAATDEHTSLRASLEGFRGKLQIDEYRQLAAEVEQARVVMEQAKSELAIHLALHTG